MKTLIVLVLLMKAIRRVTIHGIKKSVALDCANCALLLNNLFFSVDKSRVTSVDWCYIKQGINE